MPLDFVFQFLQGLQSAAQQQAVQEDPFARDFPHLVPPKPVPKQYPYEFTVAPPPSSPPKPFTLAGSFADFAGIAPPPSPPPSTPSGGNLPSVPGHDQDARDVSSLFGAPTLPLQLRTELGRQAAEAGLVPRGTVIAPPPGVVAFTEAVRRGEVGASTSLSVLPSPSAFPTIVQSVKDQVGARSSTGFSFFDDTVNRLRELYALELFQQELARRGDPDQLTGPTAGGAFVLDPSGAGVTIGGGGGGSGSDFSFDDAATSNVGLWVLVGLGVLLLVFAGGVKWG